MSNDANRFQQFAWFAIDSWMVPLYLTIAMAMLVNMLGVAALSGIGVLVLSLFVVLFCVVRERFGLDLLILVTTELLLCHHWAGDKKYTPEFIAFI